MESVCLMARIRHFFPVTDECGATYGRGRCGCSMVWSPHDAGRVLSVDEEALCTWAVDDGGALSSSGRTAQTTELSHKLAGGLWDPHDAHAAASWAGAGVAVWDLRTHARSGGIAHAHETPVRHADYNPQRPHQLATAGDDGRVKVRLPWVENVVMLCEYGLRIRKRTTYSEYAFRARGGVSVCLSLLETGGVRASAMTTVVCRRSSHGHSLSWAACVN